MTIETLLIEGIATPVSRIGLGTWAIGGWMWGGADDDRSVTTIRSALERGKAPSKKRGALKLMSRTFATTTRALFSSATAAIA